MRSEVDMLTIERLERENAQLRDRLREEVLKVISEHCCAGENLCARCQSYMASALEGE